MGFVPPKKISLGGLACNYYVVDSYLTSIYRFVSIYRQLKKSMLECQTI